MTDLINRQDLMAKMLLQHEDYRSQGATDMALGYGSAICDVKQAPAVDAEPVKLGKWKGYLIPHWTKRYDDDGEPEYKYHAEYVCNICGYNSIIKHNYCPHCGAKNVED